MNIDPNKNVGGVKSTSTAKSTSVAAPSTNRGVYWIGADGNIWWKQSADGGAINMGKPTTGAGTNTAKGFDSATKSVGATQIADPNAPIVKTNIVGDGSGSKYKDTSASQRATQQSIDSLTTAEANGLGSIASEFDRLMGPEGQYSEEEALNSKNHDTQVTSNENTRTNSLQSALVGAAQGGRGMRATLASLGAFDGTGSILANRAVADSANKDIGEGNKVFDANATQIGTAWEGTVADQKRRREEATAARANEEAAVRQNIAKERQSLYEKMAGYKADAGDQGGADLFTGMMGDLAGQTINPRAAVAKYSPRDIKFEAGKMASYLGGANDMTVKVAGGDIGGTMPALNSPLYALTKKRDMELV